jgi:autotransporter-associated beta strand protein
MKQKRILMKQKKNLIFRIASATMVWACSHHLHAQTVLEGETLNLSNGSYTSANIILQGGTVSGSGSYNAYGASVITGVTVSGTAASTITGSSWFNLGSSTTFTVADVTGSSASDLLVNTSLRSLPGDPDWTYLYNSKIVKEGAGTMEVTVQSYFNAGLDLNGGTLKVSGGNGGFGFFSGAVNVNSGTTLTIDSDGTGFGFQNGWKPTSVNINGGTVNGGGNHVWGISGGVNMTGGTLQVETGSFQWNYTNLNTYASADTATISGPLNLRGDGGYTGLSVNVANGAAASDLLISGNITELYGPLGISKSGAGTMVLSGTNSYTGATIVNAGTLVVNGSIANATTTTVQSGATISGGGSVGSLTVESGAFVNPGNSPGILTVNGDYNQAGTFVAEITGLTAGSQHDQLVVNGTVSLSGSLDVQFSAGSYAVNDMIFLLVNDDADAVNGIFTGINQGDTVTNYGGFDWIISYNADSTTSTFTGGNDIALRAIPEPSASLLAGLGALALLRRRRSA